jgi:hypothetical protein
MSRTSFPRCRFGDNLTFNDANDFTVQYLRKQFEFGFEEIGDQLDDSPETIASIVGSENEELHYEEAKGIRYCLAQRYLGLCSLANCSTKELVSELIEEVVTVQVN